MECVNQLHYLSFGIVPVFPYRLRRSKACLTCLNDSQQRSIELFSWWQVVVKFIGLVIILIAMMFGFAFLQADKKQQMAILASPQVHDFYLVDYSLFRQESYYQKQFLVAKVTAVDDEAVSLQLANYRYQRHNQVIKAIKLDNLIKPNYFSKEHEQVTHSKLKQLFSEGAIYQVLRAQGLTLFGGIVEMPSQPEPLYKGFEQNRANQDGISFYQDGQFKEALAKFLEAAEQGDMHAQVNLAEMYRDGQGVEVDLIQAVFWYQQAAAQGYEKAQVQVRKLCLEPALCKPQD
ncbi:hypothetical protein PULV_a3169 [Pseudoalteromonas ulvae UL12]|nr:hypothetical protein [Pseudoalteromonas ulvae UL12]